MPVRTEVPDAIRHPLNKAQEIWTRAQHTAVAAYGEGQRAYRIARTALKEALATVGEQREREQDRGASALHRAPRSQGQQATRPAARVGTDTTKAHLMEVAKQLEVPGRSRMSKGELIEAIEQTSSRSMRKPRQR